MSLETPTPDGVLELFRDEIVVREAEIGGQYDEIIRNRSDAKWENPFPGVETLKAPGGPTLVRVTFRRLIGRGAFKEADRIRHELRQLRNEVRAATPSGSQAEFVTPKLTHVDRPDGVEVICYTHGIVRQL